MLCHFARSSPQATEASADRRLHFTQPHYKEVARLRAQGKTGRAIAAELGIPSSTVFKLIGQLKALAPAASQTAAMGQGLGKQIVYLTKPAVLTLPKFRMP
jgi:DNA-binding NarL/FixJ family response regulator